MRSIYSMIVVLSFAHLAFPAEPKDSCVTVIGEKGGAGSGTVVKSGDKSAILTNKHIVIGGNKAYILSGGVLTESKTIVYDNLFDMAIVVVDRKLPAVELANEELAIGDEVVHYGRASGPSNGKVSNFVEYEDKTTAMLTTCYSYAGDSGCGVFNKDNKLCGVNWGRRGGITDGLQAGVRLPDLKSFLRRSCP